MTAFQPISQQRHAGKRWQRPAGFGFVAKDTAVPLTAADLTRAVMSMPIGFAEVGGVQQPVAVMGLMPGRNVFVAPDGRWVGPYVPALLRAYPFALMKAPEDRQVLCINEDSGLLVEGNEGEPFFGESGEPSPALTEILKFLQQLERSRQMAQRATATLVQHDLLEAWPIVLKAPDGEHPLPGLFRVNETKLNTLDAAALLEVRQVGALPLAYAQLLSMQHMSVLGSLAEAQAKALQKIAERQAKMADLTKGRDLDLEFMNSETLSFGALR